MDKEKKVILECMNLFADYFISRDGNIKRTFPLRHIKDKIYTLFNPTKKGDGCCPMEENKSNFIDPNRGGRE